MSNSNTFTDLNTSNPVTAGWLNDADAVVFEALGDGSLNPPTTAAEVRANIDVNSATDLASTANAKGASLIGIEDAAANFTATTVEGALAEQVSNLASTASGKGASLIGVEDTGGDFTATTQEGVNAEIADKLDGTSPITPDINGGSVDNTPIGASTANTGAFTTLSANTKLNITGYFNKNPVFDVDASVAANALTVTINETYIDFRSATLTDGTPTTVEISSPISMTVSSGSTLGTVNGNSERLAILAINNAGTAEVAIVNLSGGVNLAETSLISTTAEGGAGGADSASTIYSTTARSNVAFRVVGFIDITEATAGTWATAPTLVQGAGGNSITSMQSLGYGVPSDVVGSRSAGTTYYNTTGRPKWVAIKATSSSTTASIVGTVNGISAYSDSTPNSGYSLSICFLVSPGGSYSVATTNSTLAVWAEQY